MYKAITIILACLCLYFVPQYFNANKSTNDAETLVVGTNSEFLPFSFIKDGEIVGFDIDVAKEVCKRLDKKYAFKDMPFDALIPELSFGNVDFIAAGMSYTKERAQRVSFTKPYLTNDPLVILTRSHSGSDQSVSLDDLSGKSVVVNEGYTADLFLSDNTDLELIRLSAPVDGFLALTSGRADAFVTAESTVNSFLETQDGGKFQFDVIEGVSENCALVVSKKNPKLLAEIQTALDVMEKDGTMAQLKNKWKL